MEKIDSVSRNYGLYFGPGEASVIGIERGNNGQVFGVEVQKEGWTGLFAEFGGDVDLPEGEWKRPWGCTSHFGRGLPISEMVKYLGMDMDLEEVDCCYT